MNTQKLIDRFNKPDVQLVVSGWPERKPGHKGYHGDAAFTKETLLSLVKEKNLRFVVIAEVNTDNRPELTADGKILVLRVIDHGKFHLYPTILTWLNKFPKVKHVTVHSNFTYSGMKHFILLIPFLALIRLTGRKVSLVAHNIVNSLDFLAKQLDAPKFVISPLNHAVKLYNKTLGIVTNHVVVLDIVGKKILKNHIPNQKLVYLPHFVRPRKIEITKYAAKKRLGIEKNTKLIISFGFVSYYKGSDLIARLFAKKLGNKRDYKLLFVGGRSPSLAHTTHYQTFFCKFVDFIKQYKNIDLTGFVPDTELDTYFAAADLVILPYRGLMGGSGAFGYTAGYQKPFLLSSRMRDLCENPDISYILSKSKMNPEEILFELNSEGIKKIKEVVHSGTTLKKLEELSKQIKNVRNITKITEKMYNALYQSDYVTLTARARVKPAFRLHARASLT